MRLRRSSLTLPNTMALDEMKVFVKQLFMMLSSCFLVACAASGESLDEPPYASESRGRDCISQSSIRDYQVLDDSNLIVTASVKRHYHVALSRRAFGLRSQMALGFTSRTGSICAMSGDVVLDESFGPERISIRSIRELNPDELDALLIRFGKKEPEIKQAPATEEVEGAEVEELD